MVFKIARIVLDFLLERRKMAALRAQNGDRWSDWRAEGNYE